MEFHGMQAWCYGQSVVIMVLDRYLKRLVRAKAQKKAMKREKVT